MSNGRYELDGRTASLTPAGAGLPGGTNQSRSSFSDRAVLSEISKPSVGEGKVGNHLVCPRRCCLRSIFSTTKLTISLALKMGNFSAYCVVFVIQGNDNIVLGFAAGLLQCQGLYQFY